MESKNETVYVDSVSEGICRLLIGDGAKEVTMPLEFLPEGAQEGDLLTMTFALDTGRTRQAKAEIETLAAELGNDL